MKKNFSLFLLLTLIFIYPVTHGKDAPSDKKRMTASMSKFIAHKNYTKRFKIAIKAQKVKRAKQAKKASASRPPKPTEKEGEKCYFNATKNQWDCYISMKQCRRSGSGQHTSNSNGAC